MSTNHNFIDWEDGTQDRYTLTFERESDDLLVRAQAQVWDRIDDLERPFVQDVEVNIYEASFTDQEGNPVAGTLSKEEIKEMQEGASNGFFEYFQDKLDEEWRTHQEELAESLYENRYGY